MQEPVEVLRRASHILLSAYTPSASATYTGNSYGLQVKGSFGAMKYHTSTVRINIVVIIL